MLEMDPLRTQIIENLDTLRMTVAKTKNDELLNRLDKLEILIMEEQIAFDKRLIGYDSSTSKRNFSMPVRKHETLPSDEQDPDQSFSRLSAMLEESILVGQHALEVAQSGVEMLEESHPSSSNSPSLWAELQGHMDAPSDPPAYEAPKPISEDEISTLETLLDQFTTSQTSNLGKLTLLASFLVLCMSLFIASRNETLNDLTCHCVCPTT